MRIVLDTNVLISGIFFTGPPFEILDAWRQGRVALVASPGILDEYQRVGQRLAARFAGIDIGPILALVAIHAELVDPPPLSAPVCADPSDDKFIACAIAGACDVIVSGDAHLLRVSGLAGIDVVSPRAFVENYLAN